MRWPEEFDKVRAKRARRARVMHALIILDMAPFVLPPGSGPEEAPWRGLTPAAEKELRDILSKLGRDGE